MEFDQFTVLNFGHFRFGPLYEKFQFVTKIWPVRRVSINHSEVAESLKSSSLARSFSKLKIGSLGFFHIHFCILRVFSHDYRAGHCGHQIWLDGLLVIITDSLIWMDLNAPNPNYFFEIRFSSHSIVVCIGILSLLLGNVKDTKRCVTKWNAASCCCIGAY